MKIKRNDNVIMLGGKDRGKTGKVSIVLPKEDKIVVEGLNLVKRHVRARKQGQKGQIISKERAIPVSSVALVCKSCSKPTRVGYRIEESNPDAKGSGLRLQRRSKVRICKKCKGET